MKRKKTTSPDTLAAYWEEYKKETLPNVPETFDLFRKCAFYFGADAFFRLTSKASKNKRTGRKLFRSILNELNEWLREGT